MELTFGQKKMSPIHGFPPHITEAREQAAALIDNIYNWTIPPGCNADQTAEWNRKKALAYTNIQQGVLWAIESENI